MKKATTQTSKWHTEPPRSHLDLILEYARVTRKLWTNTKRTKNKRPRPAWTTTLKTGGGGGSLLWVTDLKCQNGKTIDTTFQNKNTCEVVQSFVRQQSPKPRCCIPPETHSSTITNIRARFLFTPDA